VKNGGVELLHYESRARVGPRGLGSDADERWRAGWSAGTGKVVAGHQGKTTR